MQVGQLLLQSFYEERESPPGPGDADAGTALDPRDQPKELLDSLQSGDDADAAASSSHRRCALSTWRRVPFSNLLSTIAVRATMASPGVQRVHQTVWHPTSMCPQFRMNQARSPLAHRYGPVPSGCLDGRRAVDSSVHDHWPLASRFGRDQ